jgi:hypothetical protein
MSKTQESLLGSVSASLCLNLFRISDFGFRISLRVIRLLLIASLLGFVVSAPAQQFTPHVGYVYPAGGRQGTTFQVRVGGQYLNGATNAFVTGNGVRAAVLEHTKPLTPQEFNSLRDQLKELQDKRVAAFQNGRKRGAQGGAQTSTNAVWTDADAERFAKIRQKLVTLAPKRNVNPAIGETVTLRVTLGPDVEPGEHELRLGTLAGLSNPLLFCVGQLPEFNKKEPRIADDATALRQLRNNTDQKAVPPTEMSVTLPATINGQTLPGGVDRYRFNAHTGQRLVIAASARELIPYLADAVPGWFQASLALYDGKGHELQHADHYRFHPDPVLLFEVPKDGEYVAEIRDSIYRGREDFVYRITIGEVPFITSIFPLGGPAGAQTSVELTGWNLPAAKLTMDAKGKEPGVYSLSVSNEVRSSNPMPFAVDDLPEALEREPNDSAATAQVVTLPVIINGRIDKPGDWDVFRFEGHAGQQVVADVEARRLDSPLDSVLRLTDAAGKQLAFNDDHEDKGAGLDTHYADSYLRFTLPADGAYYVYLGDAQQAGGPEYAYRLRLGAPQPDFALRVVPSSITARAGMNIPITVYALRKDGFTNEITLALRNAPEGFTVSGAKVPSNVDQVRFTLSASAAPRSEPFNLGIEGSAMIQGREVVHPAVPAEDMMQAFLYRHLVPSQQMAVSVAGNGRAMSRAWVKILGAMPVKIPAGGTARVRVGAPSNAFAERFQLELSEPPEGITLQNVSAVSEGAELVLRCDPAKVKPGFKGNLIVNIFADRSQAGEKKAKKQANQRRAAVGVLPAIPFEVVEPEKLARQSN